MSENDLMELVKMKREQFTVQIRKQRREDVFRAKRVIKSKNMSPTLDDFAMQHLRSNLEKLQLFLYDKLEDIKRLYEQLPGSEMEIIKTLNLFKKFVENEPEVAKIFIRSDILKIAALFLDKQFEFMPDLQTEAGNFICNFIGTINKNDLEIAAYYTSQLNVISRQLITSLKRVLEQDNAKTAESMIYCFGNVCEDRVETFLDFIADDGFPLLLKWGERDNFTDLILWVFGVNYQQKMKSLLPSQSRQLMPLVDRMMVSSKKDTLENCFHILLGMSEVEVYVPFIVKMNNFAILLNYIPSSDKQLSSLALDIVCNSCWFEGTHQIVMDKNIFELFSLKLSSFSENQKSSTLFGLENLFYSGTEQMREMIINHQSIVEKIINIGYSTSRKLQREVGQFVMAVIEIDERGYYIEKLVQKGLVGYISHVMNNQGAIELLAVLPIIGAIFDLNDKLCIGRIEKRSYLMQMLEAKSVIHKLVILTNHPNNKVVEIANELISRFEEMLGEEDL